LVYGLWLFTFLNFHKAQRNSTKVVIVSFWRMPESILKKQVSLLSKHLGKPKYFIEIANIEYRLKNLKMDSDIRQNDSASVMRTAC